MNSNSMDILGECPYCGEPVYSRLWRTVTVDLAGEKVKHGWNGPYKMKRDGSKSIHLHNCRTPVGAVDKPTNSRRQRA